VVRRRRERMKSKEGKQKKRKRIQKRGEGMNSSKRQASSHDEVGCKVWKHQQHNKYKIYREIN